MACTAATAALSPNIMKAGSMRTEPNAIWEVDRQTGTNRFVHSVLLGVMQRYEIEYGSKPPTSTFPSFFTMRSEEHTSELQSLMRISYAVFCLKKKKNIRQYNQAIQHM